MCKYCDNCEYLDPKESEQTNGHIPHICRLNHRILPHNGMHPHISTPDDCPLSTTSKSVDLEMPWRIILYTDNGRKHYVEVKGLTQASVIKKLTPVVPEVLTLQTLVHEIFAVHSSKITAIEFMEDDCE